MGRKILVLYLLLDLIIPSVPVSTDALVTDLVYLDIDIDGQEAGRIIIGLFGATTPKTVQNFISLANHEYGYGYRGSIFHRLIPNFMMQGGDFTKGDGTGGYSIYGLHFRDENFIHLHYGAGWVCMANAGQDTNGSQFYITFVVTPWIDGTHTCFGKVVYGMDTVRKCEMVATGENDRPDVPVQVYDSGTLPLKKPFLVSKSDAISDELDENVGTITNYEDAEIDDGFEEDDLDIDNEPHQDEL